MKPVLKVCYLFSIVILLSVSSKAQFVNIPDTAFRSYLLNNFPAAMLGTQLDTTHVDVITETFIDCYDLKIKNLDGIQYFDALQTLQCNHNLIHSIPKLPPGLIQLNCLYNQLDSLPTLPLSITSINCSFNKLKTIPSLPFSINSLNCSYNYIDSLPTLPNSLSILNCHQNILDSLPTLPNSLAQLICSNNYIASLPILPASLTDLQCSYNPLYNLPVLPNNLINLSCDQDSISILPILPPTLQRLSCANNLLNNLPTLPVGLNYLNCNKNQINILPALPPSLVTLACNNNNLPVLPTLPNTIYFLDCSYNLIPSLPLLPASLEHLDYSANPISTLPLLPANLKVLDWNSNVTPILPVLPGTLHTLHCSNSSIDSLPLLPNGLIELICVNDSLSFLPLLPNTLKNLDFSYNELNAMPLLPPTLFKLFFGYNLINYVPDLPLTIRELDCSGNLNLSCIPKFYSHMRFVSLSNTMITCLPNYYDIVTDLNQVYPGSSMPLCVPASGCPCAWNINGNVHSDTSATCLLDSLNPSNRVNYINMNLYKNSMLIDQLFLNVNGEYSFDTGDNDTLDVAIDSIGLPFKITCPTTGSIHVIVTPSDSLKTNINFGVECNGIDAGVKSINGRFRPGQITHVNVWAGNMAKFYNVSCPYIYSATITTILDGPVQYLMPTATALTPSVVTGNTITYNVPDMSLIDVYTAFGIEVITDTGAAIGSEVCITANVTNVLADINLSNNAFHICIPVVNSFDPNAKLVSPKDQSKAGDLLTYTIHFQNTGNDTAYKVVIRDTLSENLDVSTFKFLAASHDVEIDIQNNVLTFYFNRINLLDSFHHEPQSHGWIQFKIRLKNNLITGTQTPNRAAIYFDFNDPIFTDTAFNYIGYDPAYMTIKNPIVLPTAISPNHDGLNDTWHVLNRAYLLEKDIQIQQVFIMNRWGQKVFISSGDSFQWGGFGNSISETFVYYIIYKTRSGNIRDQRGEVTVVGL